MEMNFNLCIGNLAKFALLGTVLSWDAARRDSAFLRTAVGRRTPGSGMFQGSCGTPHAGIRHVLGQFGDAARRGSRGYDSTDWPLPRVWFLHCLPVGVILGVPPH